MTVRRRILLAALAVGVAGILVVLFLSASPEDARPRLSFALVSYTTNWGRFATVRVTNPGGRVVTVSEHKVFLQGDPVRSAQIARPGAFRLAVGASSTVSVPVYLPPRFNGEAPTFGNETNKWQLRCYVPRETFSARLGRRLQKVPFIGPHIRWTADYEVASDWFEQ